MPNTNATKVLTQLAPYFLATNRGFYCGELNPAFNNLKNGSLLFTSNVRRATVFSSYESAEYVFKYLLHNGTCDANTISCYCAILVAPIARLTSSVAAITYELPQLPERNLDAFEYSLHSADCTCCSGE